MFVKPFRIKSNTQLKTSDKKRLRQQLAQQFPTLSAEDVALLIPLKQDVSSMKLFCNKGEHVLLYVCGSEPIVFTVDQRDGTPLFLPTVYLCWRFPHATPVPSFNTHPDVIGRMQQGANLMMPGVIVQGGKLTRRSFGEFRAGVPAAVLVHGAVVAVGTVARGSTDLYMAGGYGMAVTVLHVCGDYLWAQGNKALPPFTVPLTPSPPAVTPPATTPTTPTTNVPKNNEERWKSFRETGEEQRQIDAVVDGGEVDRVGKVLNNLELQDGEESGQQQTGGGDAAAMDALLVHCFLKALQQSKGALPLPLLTSSFYRLHVLPACPDGSVLDIKKSSHKKFSKFLKSMEERGILEVTEHPKGIENVTKVSYEHEDVKYFRYNKSETAPKIDPNAATAFHPPVMEEVLQVSGDTIAFFRACGKSKGEVLTRSEVRDAVTSYIKKKNLADPETKLVNLEPTLHGAVIAKKEGYVRQMKWDQVFSRLLGRMSPAVRIYRPGYPTIIKKGKIEPIEMVVVKRMGNKKVTLIYNLTCYGIVESEFARQVQLRAAASTCVGPAEHRPQGTTQVLVQGNQTAYVASLLLETYNIPRKFIKGLELIPKGKKLNKR